MAINIYRALGALLVVAGLMTADSATACPCGCGAVNAQVMYPGENWRFALTVSHDSGFAPVSADGRLGSESSPTSRQTLTLGLARSFSDSLSATISLPMEINYHPDAASHGGFSDPSLSLRYSLLQQTIAEPLLPGLQLFATLKPSLAKSLYDQPIHEYQMDIHGNGLNEGVAGLDVWYDLSEWKLGVQQNLILPMTRINEGSAGTSQAFTPGLGAKLAVSAGYNWIGAGQLLGIIEQELRQPNKISGKEIPRSRVRVNNFGVAATVAAGPRRSIGINLKRTAAFGSNQNTTRADSIAIFYMAAI